VSNVWTRECRLEAQAAGEASWQGPSGTGAKLLSLFLEHCLGYTYVSETVAGGNSFRSTEKNGVNGAFSGTDKNFADAIAAAFVPGDVGKKIVVASTTGWNGGVYRIAAYVDANTVLLDTRSGPAEFPAAQSGLTWFLVGDTYQRPANHDDFIRYQSPAGWQIELRLNYSLYYRVFAIRVSPNGVWTGDNAKVIGPVYYGHGGSNNYEQTATNWYLYFMGNTEGTFLHVWLEHATLGGNLLCSVGTLVPIDVGHSSDELVSLVGFIPNLGAYNDYSKGSAWATRTYGGYSGIGHGYAWVDIWYKQIDLYAMENAWGGNSTGFTSRSGEINQRTGKDDLIVGTLYLIDPDNTNGRYEYLGYKNDHNSIRNNITRRAALDVDGTRDQYHINNGIVVAWPGVTPQL